jgi:putative transposase
VKYAWIRDQTEYPVRRLCQALNVSASGYYAWRGRKPGPRAQANARLLERIRRLHVQSREAYGALRLWQALRREGEACGRHRVRQLRRADGIQAKRRQRYVRTRGTYQRVPAASNLLAWPFSSPRPDAVWVADISFVPTRAGWLGNPPAISSRQKWSYAARANLCIGVMPPSAMFGRSWLYVQSQRVAVS